MHPLISLILTFAPPAPSYPQSTAELDAALAAVGGEATDFGESIKALERAIDHVTQHPDSIPDDAHTQDKLAEARLALVWLHLANADEAAATVAMDEAIRSARGRALPAGKFGPVVLRLYEDRSAALKQQGTAVIEVDCGQRPCTVIIEERRATNPSDPLYLGSYRVWIGATAGARDWEFRKVSLDEPGETERLVYQAGIVPANTESDQSPAKPRKRMLPRWVSIVGLTAGAGLVTSGVVLLSLDGKCKNGGEPVDAATCPELYDASPAAVYALIGSGVGLSLLSGIMLTLDEVRVGKAKARQAMLTWTLRF